MLKHVSRARCVGAWCSAVAVIGMDSVAGGAAINTSNGAWLLMTGLVPLAVMLLVWRDAPRITVAELLHLVYRPSNEDRR